MDPTFLINGIGFALAAVVGLVQWRRGKAPTPLPAGGGFAGLMGKVIELVHQVPGADSVKHDIAADLMNVLKTYSQPNAPAFDFAGFIKAEIAKGFDDVRKALIPAMTPAVVTSPPA